MQNIASQLPYEIVGEHSRLLIAFLAEELIEGYHQIFIKEISCCDLFLDELHSIGCLMLLFESSELGEVKAVGTNPDLPKSGIRVLNRSCSDLIPTCRQNDDLSPMASGFGSQNQIVSLIASWYELKLAKGIIFKLIEKWLFYSF